MLIAFEETPTRLDVVLREQRFGVNDPTCRLDPDRFVRGLLTPRGEGAIEVVPTGDGRVEVRTHGPGADWLMDNRRGFLGMEDRIPRVVAVHETVDRAARRHGSVPLARSLCTHQELITAILGQRITAREAIIQWARLVLKHGKFLPEPGVFVPPDAEVLMEIPFHDYHAMGIEMARARTLRMLGRHEEFVAACWHASDGDPSRATRSLLAIPGVGPWTAAVAGGASFGDPDALRVGDFHVKNTVAWALRGTPRGTDEEMVTTLEPYRGQRHRIVRWLQLDGWSAPARGARRPIVDIRHK